MIFWRIIRLTPTGEANLLADLSDFLPIATSSGDFHFRGAPSMAFTSDYFIAILPQIAAPSNPAHKLENKNRELDELIIKFSIPAVSMGFEFATRNH